MRERLLPTPVKTAPDSVPMESFSDRERDNLLTADSHNRPESNQVRTDTVVKVRLSSLEMPVTVKVNRPKRNQINFIINVLKNVLIAKKSQN